MNKILISAVLLGWLATMGQAVSAESYDVVIAGGRVLDPETNFDAVANVGIRDGVIVAISDQPMKGKQTIAARGLVVAPGFIDLHAHAQNNDGYSLQVRDGVTTALDQENGAYPIAQFYETRAGRSRINHGVAVSQQGLRAKLKTGLEMKHNASLPASEAKLFLQRKAEWAEAAADPNEIQTLLKLFEEQIAAGGLGLGLTPEYVPGADRREVFLLMQRAAELKVPVFTHVRGSHHAGPGGLFEMMQEVIANTAMTGGSLHVCHVTSKGLGDTSLILDALTAAQHNGMDVSTEAYPYTAGSTRIGSALFNEGWQQRWNSDYSAVEVPATGARLTADTFDQLRRSAPETYVIFHMIPDDALLAAMKHPMVMIASDGVPLLDGKGHPRGSGSYARVLGKYVREDRVLDLMTAVRKMTLLPANRMAFAPAMRKKGRVQVGMDADLTIFDPATVKDNATYQEPARPSTGIQHVLVGGVPVVAKGALVGDAYPGRGIRR